MSPVQIGLIDNRNKKLWDDLIRTQSITLKLSDHPNYACDSFNNESIILIPKNNFDIDSFTHELLHIFIRQKEIFFGAYFGQLISEDETLSQIISDALIQHISNCMDHIKMLPIFLELGFDEKKFISDYDVNKCTESEIQQLKKNYRIRGYYLTDAVDFYIGKYMAIKADPKQHISYPKSLDELRKLDSQLFGILDKCVEDWKNMPLERKNILDDDYISISFEFYENLKNWADGKSFS